jgi:hypothetical protein
LLGECIVTVLAISVAGATTASAEECWTGSGVAFSKADFADWTLPANQDQITAQTHITRATTMGLFNIVSEASYAATSPANTMWAYDLAGNGNAGLSMTATNHTSLTFETWVNAVNNTPPSAVGLPGVVHLIAEDIYIDINVSSWTQFIGGGGFGYSRGASDVGCPSPVPSLDARGVVIVTLVVLGLAWSRLRSTTSA